MGPASLPPPPDLGDWAVATWTGKGWTELEPWALAAIPAALLRPGSAGAVTAGKREGHGE